MVIKQTKSRVKQKMTESSASSSVVSGKRADQKIGAGLNLLLLAEKKAQEGWGSSTTSSSSSSPESTPLTSTKSVPPSVPVRTDSGEQPEMSNSALLQLAEMCTSELQSTTKDNRMPAACTSIEYKLNSSAVMGSELPQFHSSSTLSWHDIVSPPEKPACIWNLTTEAANACSSSTTSSKGEDTDACSKNSFVRSSMSPPDLPGTKPRCSSMESPWSSDDKYASMEQYRSVTTRRKLSSSATESIPSPSSSFGDEAEEDGVSVFLSQLEQSSGQKCSTKQVREQTNRQCPFTGLGFNSNLGDNRASLKSTQSHHKLYSHQHSSPALQRNSTHPEQSVKHEHLSTASTGSMSRPLVLTEEVPTHTHDTLRQNSLPRMVNTQQPPEPNSDKTWSTHSVDRCYPNFHKWREPVNLVKSFGETATFEPPSKNPCEDYSPVIKVNFTEWRQQHCNEWQSAVNKPGFECDNSPARAHSHDLKSSSTACHVSSTKTASLLSEGRLASLLSRTDTSREKFPHSVAEIFHNKHQGTAHQANDLNKTSLSDSKTGFHNVIEQTIPDLKLPLCRTNIKIPLLPDHVEETGPMDLTLANQVQTFSKGKLKKNWTERMLVEASQEQQFGQHQSETSGECKATGLTAPLDPVSDSYINASHRNEPGPEIPTHANVGGMLPAVGRNQHSTEMKMFLDTKSSSNMQAKLSLNHSSGSLRHAPDTSNAEFGHVQEPTSFNASRHPKLLFQLSQTHQFFKPDHLKLHTSVGNVQIKSEQDASLTNPQRGQHLFSFEHQHAVAGISMKTEARDDKREVLDSSYKNNLNQIAACGKRCVDHIVEQLGKTDFSVDAQQFGKQCSGGFPCDRGSPAVVGRSEARWENSLGMAGGKEENCDGLVKSEDQMDYSVMTASSLVEKVIKKWRDGCSANNKLDRAITNGRHVESSEGGSTALSCGSPPSWTTAGVCPNGELSKNLTGELNPHCLTVSPATELLNHTDLTEHISPKPVRKSRRANRGKKYQELIKEGVIQPSRERLAARNAEKQGADTGDLAPEETAPFPAYTLEPPNKRKSRRRHCDSESTETIDTGHVTSTDNTPSLGSSTAKVSPPGGSRLKAETSVTEYLAAHIALPNKHLPTQPVTGSQKRKARKHCITRISILKEAKEMVNSPSPGLQCPIPHKKPYKVAS